MYIFSNYYGQDNQNNEGTYVTTQKGKSKRQV